MVDICPVSGCRPAWFSGWQAQERTDGPGPPLAGFVGALTTIFKSEFALWSRTASLSVWRAEES